MIEDLGVKLHPLTKRKLYRAAAKIISHKMYGGGITPERAKEIAVYLREKIKTVDSPEKAKGFYLRLADKFPEMEGLKRKMEMQEEEKQEEVFSHLLAHILAEHDFELAGEVMAEMESLSVDDKMAKLREKFPKKFVEALREVEEGRH